MNLNQLRLYNVNEYGPSSVAPSWMGGGNTDIHGQYQRLAQSRQMVHTTATIHNYCGQGRASDADNGNKDPHGTH
jgi:hypothetical protein